MSMIRIYTDGACSGNPGIGGWACVLKMKKIEIKKSGYEIDTTNNRMELRGVLEALRLVLSDDNRLLNINIKRVEIISDSAYIINSINNHWLTNWKLNGWKTKKGQPVKNQDLWQELIDLYTELKRNSIKVSFIKVKGHDGNECNEIADKLAVLECKKAKGMVK